MHQYSSEQGSWLGTVGSVERAHIDNHRVFQARIWGMCQVVVDSARQVIKAARATTIHSDKKQAMLPWWGMPSKIPERGPVELSDDAGYYYERVVEDLHAQRVDRCIAPRRIRHGRVLEQAALGRIPKGMRARDRMRRKLRTKQGWKPYTLWLETTEPVFGQIN